MELKLHPQISRIRRQSAVEQTSDLLRAYLEHWPDPFAPSDELAEPNGGFSELTAGFIIPQTRSA